MSSGLEEALRELRQLIWLIEGQLSETSLIHNLEDLKAEVENIEETVREFRKRSEPQ